MCIVSGRLVCIPPSIFRNSFQKTEICSDSLAFVKLATAKLKMKTLLAGFPVASVVPPSNFPTDIAIEVFLLVDLLLVFVDVLDVSVQEIAVFPSGEHLAFCGIASFSV